MERRPTNENDQNLKPNCCNYTSYGSNIDSIRKIDEEIAQEHTVKIVNKLHKGK